MEVADNPSVEEYLLRTDDCVRVLFELLLEVFFDVPGCSEIDALSVAALDESRLNLKNS